MKSCVPVIVKRSGVAVIAALICHRGQQVNGYTLKALKLAPQKSHRGGLGNDRHRRNIDDRIETYQAYNVWLKTREMQ